MPVIGSSAYAQVSQVTSGARALLNDQQGNVYSDTVLLPHFNLAYQELWTALENSGQETFITDEAFLIVPAINQLDPTAQVIIQDTSVLITQAGSGTAFQNPSEAGPPNTLPVNMMNPLKLWERQAGNPAAGFVEMIDRTGKGGLPSIQQSPTCLIFWEWREDGLAFLGALEDIQIRMRYASMLPQVTDSTAQVLVRNGINFLTYKTAYLAANAKGGASAPTLLPLVAEALFQLQLSAARRDQRNPKRRRPRRGGFRGWL
jgi:hypothetical protein